MNKKILICYLSIAACMFSCYEDFVTLYYDFTGVYFNKTSLSRSVVYGDNDDFEIQVATHLSGDFALENTHEVYYEIDNDLLGSSYTPLPEDYYTLSDDSKFIISEGNADGYITIEFDKDKFKNDEKLLSNTADGSYALAFRIVNTTADTILAGKAYQVIPIKYINTYEGNYYAAVTHTQPDGTVTTYGSVTDYYPNSVTAITTEGFDKCSVATIAGIEGNEFMMTVNSDNSVTCSSIEGSGYEVSNNGTCTWDPATRYFTLDIKYNKTGETDVYKVSQTLIFRNRVRDGYSEWRWEGFEGN